MWRKMNRLIELLQRRGFLIDELEGSYYLSDNASSGDVDYLNKILHENNIGYVDSSRRIHIEHVENAPSLLSLFRPIPCGRVGGESNNRIHDWYKIWKRECADKIEVRHLEANVAMYIKALSACGIYTGGCCDGNHPGHHRLYIQFDGPVYSELHRVLWTSMLGKRFQVHWNNTYTKVNLSNNRQKQYNELFEAAMFLYDNRKAIRQARKEAGKWIGNKKVLSLIHI